VNLTALAGGGKAESALVSSYAIALPTKEREEKSGVHP